jgi:hypothetical protein
MDSLQHEKSTMKKRPAVGKDELVSYALGPMHVQGLGNVAVRRGRRCEVRELEPRPETVPATPRDTPGISFNI